MAEKANNYLVGAVLGFGALATLVTLGRKKRRQADFKNKVVLITGGSRGLGLVLARTFAAKKAKIAICARNADELERAKQDLQAMDAEVFSGVCDVREREQVNRFVEDVTAHFGQIDILVNNAGVIQVGPLADQTSQDFEDALAVHFWGPFYMMQAVAPQMKKREAGHIVNIASIGGKINIPHLAPYCASKFALVGLSGAMRVELAKDNIFVTTVCPGLMRTGSHINAIFKGQNELEFALFSTLNALPLTSVSAEKAAREIVAATRCGDAEIIISVPAQAAAKGNALLPELVSEIFGLVNQILPGAGGIGKNYPTGLESTSLFSPSFLTTLLDRAARRNNELKPDEQLA